MACTTLASTSRSFAANTQAPSDARPPRGTRSSSGRIGHRIPIQRVGLVLERVTTGGFYGSHATGGASAEPEPYISQYNPLTTREEMMCLTRDTLRIVVLELALPSEGEHVRAAPSPVSISARAHVHILPMDVLPRRDRRYEWCKFYAGSARIWHARRSRARPEAPRQLRARLSPPNRIDRTNYEVWCARAKELCWQMSLSPSNYYFRASYEQLIRLPSAPSW